MKIPNVIEFTRVLSNPKLRENFIFLSDNFILLIFKHCYAMSGYYFIYFLCFSKICYKSLSKLNNKKNIIECSSYMLQ